MKKHLLFAITLLCLTLSTTAQLYYGGWAKANNDNTTQTVLIVVDNYFMQTDFDKATKKFIGTVGGTCVLSGDGKLQVLIEFNTYDNTEVGTTITVPYKLDNGNLITTLNDQNITWNRIDNLKGELAVNWRITDREQDGKMTPMRAGPRKTLKILSGTRFQWAAINPQTKEFFGTGGGTYSFAGGKYTENIEFFSRDSSRVGVSLSFDGAVQGKRWTHTGKSSTGGRVAEVWTRQTP